MIWDASDANPMHRRIPAEIVSRRTHVPRKLAPQEKERENEDVVVDLKAAIALKPETRPRWLGRACKMVSEDRASSTELYNIIVSRKFSSGIPDRVARRLIAVIEESVELFSDKQQRYLLSSDCPLMVQRGSRVDTAIPDEEAEDTVTAEQDRSAAAATATADADAANAALALAGSDTRAHIPSERASAMDTQHRRERAAREALRDRRQAENGVVGPVPASAKWTNEEGAAKWQVVQDEASLRRQAADARAQAQREAARREERKRQQDAEEEVSKRRALDAEEGRKRKLEEEADDIFNKALVPQQAIVQIEGNEKRRRSRSISGQRSGSRSISSRTARRRARAPRRGRHSDWRESGNVLTGSRALLLNRDYVEDLPHLPRPSGEPPVRSRGLRSVLAAAASVQAEGEKRAV